MELIKLEVCIKTDPLSKPAGIIVSRFSKFRELGTCTDTVRTILL